MVLRGFERQDMLAIDQGEIAGFLAGQEFLDHHLAAGGAELAGEHILSGGAGLHAGVSNNHALAGGEAIRLDHQGRGMA